MEKKQVIYEIKELDSLIFRKNLKNFNNMPRPASVHQGFIIRYLIENKNQTVYQRDLEKALGIRRSTISGILKTMEKNEIIERYGSENDTRLKKVELTKKAKSKHFEMQKNFEKLEDELVFGISEDDLHTFFKVTNKIKENLRR